LPYGAVALKTNRRNSPATENARNRAGRIVNSCWKSSASTRRAGDQRMGHRNQADQRQRTGRPGRLERVRHHLRLVRPAEPGDQRQPARAGRNRRAARL